MEFLVFLSEVTLEQNLHLYTVKVTPLEETKTLVDARPRQRTSAQIQVRGCLDNIDLSKPKGGTFLSYVN